MSRPTHVTLYKFLKGNLGKKCLAPLTGTDADALNAALQVANLWARERRQSVALAFRHVVLEMQPHTRELAYHAIAHCTDWSFRDQLWNQANLPPFNEVRIAADSPEARQLDHQLSNA